MRAAVKGDAIGRYVIRGRIGEGGMGIVYRARDTVLGRDVALKTAVVDSELGEEVVARFNQEARAVSAIGHRNVVTLYDFGVFEGAPFIAMELLKGEDLATLLERERVSVERAVEIVMEVCAGMDAAHRRQIVHRDLHLGNVFLAKTDEYEETKVLDFGISRLPASTRVTRKGYVMGNPLYLAPERWISSNEGDERSDQYSVGVVLYYALTGCQPYEAKSSQELKLAIVRGDVVRPEARRPELLPGIVAVIMRAMALEPGDRFGNLHEMGAALVGFAGESVRSGRLGQFFRGPRPGAVRFQSVTGSTLGGSDPSGSGPVVQPRARTGEETARAGYEDETVAVPQEVLEAAVVRQLQAELKAAEESEARFLGTVSSSPAVKAFFAGTEQEESSDGVRVSTRGIPRKSRRLIAVLGLLALVGGGGGVWAARQRSSGRTSGDEQAAAAVMTTRRAAASDRREIQLLREQQKDEVVAHPKIEVPTAAITGTNLPATRDVAVRVPVPSLPRTPLAAEPAQEKATAGARRDDRRRGNGSTAKRQPRRKTRDEEHEQVEFTSDGLPILK